MDRRSKGLCFNCDEKFSAGHLCKNKQIFMITTEDEEGVEANSDEPQLFWEDGDNYNPWGTTTINNAPEKETPSCHHRDSGFAYFKVTRQPQVLEGKYLN